MGEERRVSGISRLMNDAIGYELCTAMEDAKKAWYFHAMRTWTKKDYENYEQIQLWMLGEPTKDPKKAKTIDLVKKILRKKK